VTSGNGSVGGPLAPYWTSWTYDLAGNRASQTQHALPGATGGDTMTTYNYPAPAQRQPHALTGTSTTGPGAGTTGYQYDQAGNTITRNTPANGAQTLNWDEANRLTSTTAGANTTNYVYDADGNLLMRKDNGVNTLYLGDTELVWNTAGTTVTGTRYYKQGKEVIAALDSTSDHVSYLMQDRGRPMSASTRPQWPRPIAATPLTGTSAAAVRPAGPASVPGSASEPRTRTPA